MRMKNPMLENVEGLGAGPGQKVVNIIDGAQNGIGVHIPYLDGTQALVLNPVVMIVLSYPAIWDLPGYEYNKAICKALFERHATSWSGIDFGYSLATSEGQVGRDTQQLSTPLNTSRSSVSPSCQMRELRGNLCWNFVKRWIWDINQPDTNASLISSLIENEEDMFEWVVSTYSMSMIAIQFDETMHPNNIIDAAVYTAMFPVETGDIGFERQLGSVKTMDRTFNFKALLQHNANTRELGIYIARALNLHRINYNIASTETGIHVNLKTMGIDAEQQRILNEFRRQSADGIYQFGIKGLGNGTSSGLVGDGDRSAYAFGNQRREAVKVKGNVYNTVAQQGRYYASL